MKGSWDEPDPLAALRAGDTGPFEAFVEAASGSFIAFFARMGVGRSEAEDLTQEVFLKLFRHAPHYQAKDRFGSYAWRVARNALIDHNRRRATQLRAPEGEGDGEDGPSGPGAIETHQPSDALTRAEEVQRLRNALARLSESHRLVFELGVMRELPYAEIAELLEVPVGTVKSRMFHALRKLREALGEEPR